MSRESIFTKHKHWRYISDKLLDKNIHIAKEETNEQFEK